MTRTRSFLALALLGLTLGTLFGPAPVLADGNVNFFLGQKFLKESDWAPLEEQPEAGVDVTMGGSEWPVMIHLLLSGSTDDEEFSGGDKIEARTIEVGAGINKTFTSGNFHPYLAGGLLWANADLEVTSGGVTLSGDESGIGGWVGGGGFFRLGSRFNLGAALRFSFVDVEEDFSAGGTHVGLILGWGWPATN